MTTDKTPSFSLLSEDIGSLGCFDAVAGLFLGSRGSYDEFERWGEGADHRLTVEALRFEPTQEFSRFLAGRGGTSLGNLYFHILDLARNPVGLYYLPTASLVSAPGQRDTLTFTTHVHYPPHRAAEQVWRDWRVAAPDVAGLWTRLPMGDREGWVEVASLYTPDQPSRSAWDERGEIRMPGEDIDDLASFFCAIGEAVNGPGGYFGRNPMALADCLRGLE